MKAPPKGGLTRDLSLAKGGLVRLGARVTDLFGTAWRVLYLNGSGSITELALGAEDTVFRSGGVSAAPTWIAPGVPSTQAFGDAAAEGTTDGYARTDHKHGIPADPVTAHAAAADPHTGYVLESLLDAKGDMIAASAADTPVKVTVGADGTILTADSAQATGLKWAAASSMLKTQSGGYFMIPAGPALGTVISDGVANTYGSWVEMIASTAAALYIVGIVWDAESSAITPNYLQIDIGTGAAGAEISVGEWRFGVTGASVTDVTGAQVCIFPFPIPVAISTRIALRAASDTGDTGYGYTLICINQADLVSI